MSLVNTHYAQAARVFFTCALLLFVLVQVQKVHAESTRAYTVIVYVGFAVIVVGFAALLTLIWTCC